VVHAIIQATQEVKIGGSSPRLAWAKAWDPTWKKKKLKSKRTGGRGEHCLSDRALA
jgi:hypothetical protein